MADDEEIYDDGTSITNQTVTGVRNVRAMFENSKTNHPLSRGFSAKPVGSKPAAAPSAGAAAAAAAGSKPGETTAAKRQVLPTKVEKPVLRPVKPNSNSSSPGAGAAAGMKSPPVALKPTGFRSPEAKEPNNNAPTLNKGSLGSSSSSSSSSNASNDTPPITDFRSLLKKTNRTPGSIKSPQAVAVATGGTVKTTEPKEEEKKDGGEGEATLRSGARGWKESAVRRSIVTRQHDSKRFRRNPPPSSSASQEAAPPKPPLPPGVDLAPLLQQYQAELARCGAEVEGEMDETYDDVGVAPKDRPVSMLPEMTEEEELGREEEAASAVTDEVYDDAMAAPGDKNPDEESDGETYEDLSELVQQQQDSGGSADTTSIKSDKEKNDKEAAKLRKQEEKERKEREKKEKEEKKKMERKKKEERDMRAKFKLQLEGEIELQGEGVIKKDAKGRGADLAVKATDTVGIVRMNGNPKGKWLVQNQEGKLGYVDSNNVEMMNSVSGGTDAAPKSPGPPSNGPSGGGDDDPENAVDDDIYEEV